MLRAQDILTSGRPPELAARKATVLGLARSGMAVARLLHQHGSQVLVSDSAQSESLQAAATQLHAAGIKTEIGRHSAKTLKCDFLVRSPGVPATNPILIEARQRGVLVVSEIEVAFWLCHAPIVAVTGSNGKTTTVEWLGDVFRRAKRPVAVCGNVGHPFSAAVSDLPPGGVAVVEVSSFQLENTLLFSPRLALITNFSPDHLDRYDDYDAYLKAKCRIFERLKPDAALVFNRSDVELRRRIQGAPGRKLSFGRDTVKDMGAGLQSDHIEILDGLNRRRLLSKYSLSLPGAHNLENALAVACAATDMGMDDAIIAESLRSFRGVAHRLEKVLERGGVLWINDSKATNIASGLVALESFDRPIILLAGGRDKGSDFAAVAQPVANKTRRVILFGEAALLMEKAWAKTLPATRVGSLRDAVKAAAAEAQSGDVVLLSPMCASFDEFKNYEDRGEKFKKWVREYAAQDSEESHPGH